MQNGKQPHILNAASNLLGICFVLITGLKLTGGGQRSFADEVSLLAALSFLASCVLSYISLRGGRRSGAYETVADYGFLAGLFLLFTAVIAFSYDFF